jgi:hypothetical protein
LTVEAHKMASHPSTINSTSIHLHLQLAACVVSASLTDPEHTIVDAGIGQITPSLQRHSPMHSSTIIICNCICVRRVCLKFITYCPHTHPHPPEREKLLMNQHSMTSQDMHLTFFLRSLEDTFPQKCELSKLHTSFSRAVNFGFS